MSENVHTGEVVQFAPYLKKRTNQEIKRLRRDLREHFSSPDYTEEAEEPEEA